MEPLHAEPIIRRIARKYVSGQSSIDIEDVVQDSMLHLIRWTNKHPDRPIDAPLLMHIARMRAIAAWKQARHTQYDVTPDRVDDDGDDVICVLDITRPFLTEAEASADDVFAIEQSAADAPAAVTELISKIPPRDQPIIKLLSEDVSLRKAAELLGINQRTASARAEKAISKLAGAQHRDERKRFRFRWARVQPKEVVVRPSPSSAASLHPGPALMDACLDRNVAACAIRDMYRSPTVPVVEIPADEFDRAISSGYQIIISPPTER
jgi:RNA polymerase sigma factor (sigma-70 family)